jgi:hypothetical protein
MMPSAHRARAIGGAVACAIAWGGAGCKKGAGEKDAGAEARAAAGPDAGAGAEAGAGVDAEIARVLRAEDQRRAAGITADLATHRDLAVRRRAARALARIADAPSLDGLLRALGDEDPFVTAWGAYGLGYACRGHEEAHVRALAARAVTLGGPGNAGNAFSDGDAHARGEAEIGPRTTLARAIGRCGGALAESILADWVRGHGPFAEAAAYALADLAGRRGGLAEPTMQALVSAGATGDEVDAPGRVAGDARPVHADGAGA